MIDLIRREVEAARRPGRNTRLPVPLTSGQGGTALLFEVELGSLDQLERVRHSGGEQGEDVASLMQAFSEILLAPPGVENLRVDEVLPSQRRKPATQQAYASNVWP